MSMLKEYYLQPDAPDPVLPEAEVLRCVRRLHAIPQQPFHDSAHFPADRTAALAGYTADAPVSDDFMRTWRAVTVTAAAILVAFFPDREDEATRDLRQSLSDL